MRRREIMLALAATLPAAALAQTAAAPRAGRDLDRRVRQVLDRYQAAWNASDMPAMEALYTADVHWVNVVGMHWQGREEVSYAHRALFDRSFKGVPSSLEAVESIVPAPGGAAIAVARWSFGSYRSPSGQVTPATRTRMSLFLVPHGDHLLIAHGANIDIVEAAQRSDPVQQRRQQQG